MKTALRGNWWLLTLLLGLLVVALIITVFPALQAEAQGSCRQQTVYTCVRRGYQYVCGYLTYWTCWPGGYNYTPYRGWR